jgi:hypothetical protein
MIAVAWWKPIALVAAMVAWVVLVVWMMPRGPSDTP